MTNSVQSNGLDKGMRHRSTHLIEDSLNSDIIAFLEVDGRLPFSEIANKLGVSEGTIRNRVSAMKEAGLLRIVAIADPRASEYKADAMLRIKVAPGIRPEVVAERLSALTSVVYILWVTGNYDLLVEIIIDEGGSISEFMDEHVHQHGDIGDSELMLGVKNFKNQFLLKRSWDDNQDNT